MKIGIILTILIVAGVAGAIFSQSTGSKISNIEALKYVTSIDGLSNGQQLFSDNFQSSINLLDDANSMTSFFTRPNFDYVVVIVLENRNLNQTYANTCFGNCTYITYLANNYALAENYSGVAHQSTPNYLTLTSGGNFAYSPFLENCGAQVGDCKTAAKNIVDGIEETGRTWRAYIEDWSGGCSGSSDGHIGGPIPFLFYTDIYYNATRCSRIVNANPTDHGYLGLPTTLLSDLNNVTETPNFMWLTPNSCNMGRLACNSTAISPCSDVSLCSSQANEYLSLLVPQILDSTLFTARNAALFITWDEGGGFLGLGHICPQIGPTYPTCIDTIPAILAGPYVKRNYVSNSTLSHYSFAKTLESVWSFQLPSSNSILRTQDYWNVRSTTGVKTWTAFDNNANLTAFFPSNSTTQAATIYRPVSIPLDENPTGTITITVSKGVHYGIRFIGLDLENHAFSAWRESSPLQHRPGSGASENLSVNLVTEYYLANQQLPDPGLRITQISLYLEVPPNNTSAQFSLVLSTLSFFEIQRTQSFELGITGNYTGLIINLDQTLDSVLSDKTLSEIDLSYHLVGTSNLQFKPYYIHALIIKAQGPLFTSLTSNDMTTVLRPQVSAFTPFLDSVSNSSSVVLLTQQGLIQGFQLYSVTFKFSSST